MLGKREKEVLEYLLSHSNEKVTAAILANQLGCSDRTIKSSVKLINQSFSNIDTKIETKPGRGIWLSYPPSELEHLLNLLRANKTKDSHEWQQLKLLKQLLITESPVSTQELAEILYTNANVIQRYIDNVKYEAKRFGINVMKEARKGIWIEGKELNKRNLMASLIKKKAEVTNCLDFIQHLEEEFPNIEVADINRILKKLDNQENLSLSDYTFYNILIHTVLAFDRISINQLVSFQLNELEELQNTAEWETVSLYIQMIEKYLKVSIPIEEAALLTIHFLGAKVKPDEKDSKDLNWLSLNDDLLEDVRTWIKEIGGEYGYPLMEDKLFIRDLLLHLGPLLNRLQYGINISNSWVEDVKREYGEAYEMAVEFVSKIESAYPYKITEPDIAYIALHIGAATTRINQYSSNKIPVIIVCTSGIGMSNFVKVKLEQLFKDKIEVLATVSKLDTDFDTFSCQIILSTVPLKVPGKIVVQITPILDVNEQEKLKAIFQSKVVEQKVISKFLKPELIILKSKAETWKEAVQEGVEKLIENEYVSESYYQQVIDREKLSATSIGKGFAIPHGLDSEIKKEGLACITLDKPVTWGKELVDIVFLMAITKKSKACFSDLFTEILYISQNEEQISKIRKAEKINELKTIIW